jgi:hypothetical protein
MFEFTPQYFVAAIFIAALLAFIVSKITKNEKSHTAEADENSITEKENALLSFNNAAQTDKILDEVIPEDSHRYSLIVRAKKAAKNYNEGLSVYDKLKGKNGFCAMDILQNTAMHEYRTQLEDYFEGVSSISIWRNLSKESFDKILCNVACEYRLEESSATKEEIFLHYKEKALRFAQWLEDTKHRAFFMGSVNEIESVICHIRLIAR